MPTVAAPAPPSALAAAAADLATTATDGPLPHPAVAAFHDLLILRRQLETDALRLATCQVRAAELAVAELELEPGGEGG